MEALVPTIATLRMQHFVGSDSTQIPYFQVQYILVVVGLSGTLKAKQKLGVTLNSDKLGGIDFT